MGTDYHIICSICLTFGTYGLSLKKKKKKVVSITSRAFQQISYTRGTGSLRNQLLLVLVDCVCIKEYCLILFTFAYN